MAKRRITIDHAVKPFIEGAGRVMQEKKPVAKTFVKPIIHEKQGTHRMMKKSFNEIETKNKMT